MATSRKVTKKKVKVESIGQVHIQASFNNVIVTVSNMQGQVMSWSSAGKMGFRGSKKNTPYAASQATEDCVKVAHELGMRKAEVYVKGPGSGRDSAIRTIQATGVDVISIKDITPMPHNGCRPPKRRRV